MEESVTDPTPTAADKVPAPKRICEKCRNEFPLERFQHGVEGQECVCERCLRVMGYKIK